MRRWLIGILIAVAVVEVAYLAAANIVLNLQSTQDYLNQLQPDKYKVTWDRAWSLYPFRIHVTGLSANGQSWSQQWQASAPEASASLAPLPFLRRTVVVYGVETGGVDVSFRPRPSPDRDDSKIRPYFPTIEGRDPNAEADSPPKQEEGGWEVVVDIARLSGQNSFWASEVQATLTGEAHATYMRRTRGGPMAIRDGQADATMQSLKINGQEIANSGSIKGSFGFSSYIPQQNRGLKALGYLTMDANIDVPVGSLEFLNFYLRQVTSMNLGGKGVLKGRVAYREGDLSPGTDLSISADNLTIDSTPYAVDGDGSVGVTVASDSPQTLNASFGFGTLTAYHEPDHGVLFNGKGLKVTIARPTQILPDADLPASAFDTQNRSRQVVVTIPSVTVPDLSVYQQYLPDKWGVSLNGGTGSLEGLAELSAAAVDIDLTLRSEKAQVTFRKDTFETDLAVEIKASGQAKDKSAGIDITGTAISLDNSKVKDATTDDAGTWQTRFVVTKGEAQFDLPEAADATDESAGFWGLYREKDFKSLLTTLDADFESTLNVSDLNWINVLFENPYSMAVRNAAAIKADLVLSSGSLDKGSTLTMQPQDFTVEILDYVARGNGDLTLTVTQGGDRPDLSLDAKLANALFKRSGEKDAVIEQVTLAVTATAKGVSLSEGGQLATLELKIPSAKVTDMSVYNQYLTKGSPVRINSGSADLSADVKLAEKSATGFVKLQTSRIVGSVDDKSVSGTLAVNVTINGGAAQNMDFDVSGSSVTLDGFRVSNESTEAGHRDWGGRIDLTKARVVWKKPVQLDATAAIRLADTRPIVALFESQKKDQKWLERLLTVEDVRGTATIKAESDVFIVPEALAKSDTIEAGVKGIISENEREGIFYVRYGNIAAVLEVDNDRKRFALIGATKKFEEYVPGGPLPKMKDSGHIGGSTTAVAEEKKPFSLFKKRQ